MKITKIKTLLFLPLLAMALAGCNGSNEPAPEKQSPVIDIRMEENTQFNVNEFVAPEIVTYPSDLKKTIEYSKGSTSYGSVAPTEVGDYKMTVTTEETKDYKVGFASKNFLIRQVPELSFYYLKNGQEVAAKNGDQFKVSEFPELQVKSSVAGAQITSYYSTFSGSTMDARPSEPGVYFLMASVARTETIGSVEDSLVFELTSDGGTPEIKFFYDGVEKCLESNWLDEGFAQSHYDAADFDINKLTYTVTPAGTQYTESWTLKALDAPEEAEGSPIAKPTSNPLAPGIYAVTITISNPSMFKWAGFVINDSSSTKADAEIKFFYNNQEVGISGSRWFYEGYGDSKFDASEFDINKFSYTVSEGAQVTESWSLKVPSAPEEAEGSPIAKPTNPLAAGTWSCTISVAASDKYNAQVKWIMFYINESAPAKTDAEIKFFYNNQEVGISGSRWFYEGYGDSKFDASDFDISKFSVTVTAGANYTESWSLKVPSAPEEAEGETVAKPSNPLASGTWACTISVAASDSFNAQVKWIMFYIN